MDAGWEVGALRFGARDLGAERRAALLDRARRRRRRRAVAVAASLSGQNFSRRFAHRLPDEQFVDDERRNYRGGQNRPIWIVDLKSYDLVSPPWTDSKDIDPVWVGDAVYFISDRDGVANVWAYETKAKKLTQVTRFTDFDVKSIDAGAGSVVFEQAGYVHE